MLYTGIYIVNRIKRVLHIQFIGSTRHQLHETEGAFFGYCHWIITGLRHNNRLYQGGIYIISVTCLDNYTVIITFPFIRFEIRDDLFWTVLDDLSYAGRRVFFNGRTFSIFAVYPCWDANQKEYNYKRKNSAGDSTRGSFYYG